MLKKPPDHMLKPRLRQLFRVSLTGRKRILVRRRKAIATPAAFFSDNNFYTTAANRIARHLYKNAVSCEDVAALCRLNSPAAIRSEERKAAYA